MEFDAGCNESVRRSKGARLSLAQAHCRFANPAASQGVPMIRLRLALPALLLFLAPSARAQALVWSDSFENGFADWTSQVDGLTCGGEQSIGGAPCAGAWQPIDATNVCAGWAVPFPDGAQVAWFGIQGNCTYHEDTPS